MPNSRPSILAAALLLFVAGDGGGEDLGGEGVVGLGAREGASPTSRRWRSPSASKRL
jgi:hypothetical protein